MLYFHDRLPRPHTAKEQGRANDRQREDTRRAVRCQCAMAVRHHTWQTNKVVMNTNRSDGKIHT